VSQHCLKRRLNLPDVPTALCLRDGSVIAPRIRWATTHRKRMRGLLGGLELGEGEALVLSPAAQVHTVGLGFDVDVVFCDRALVVRRVLSPLRRNRVSPWVPGARYAIELRAGASRGLSPGTALSFRSTKEVVRRSRS
jgi:uncharacterized membrane protein (UPF0127 family)